MPSAFRAAMPWWKYVRRTVTIRRFWVYIRVTAARASATYRGVRVTLVELQPYPFSSRTIAPEEYRATLTATR
jgi:hypothetical protein